MFGKPVLDAGRQAQENARARCALRWPGHGAAATLPRSSARWVRQEGAAQLHVSVPVWMDVRWPTLVAGVGQKGLVADHAEELELFDSVGADGRGEPQQPLAAVLAEQAEAVDFDRAQCRVDDAFAVPAAYRDIVLFPQPGELRRAIEEAGEELPGLPVGGGAPGDRRAQVGGERLGLVVVVVLRG